MVKSVPDAELKDPRLYEYLALVDAVRLGNPRESGLASFHRAVKVAAGEGNAVMNDEALTCQVHGMPFSWLGRKPPLPNTVYKFYGPARTEPHETFRVRFSQLAALNDPFEFLASVRPGDLRKGATRIARHQTNLFSLIGMGAGAALKASRKNDKLGGLPRPERRFHERPGWRPQERDRP